MGSGFGEGAAVCLRSKEKAGLAALFADQMHPVADMLVMAFLLEPRVDPRTEALKGPGSDSAVAFLCSLAFYTFFNFPSVVHRSITAVC